MVLKRFGKIPRIEGTELELGVVLEISKGRWKAAILYWKDK